MMKWGRKKSSLPSPSHSSSSSTLFRLSWFSKIKRMSKNIECKPTKGKIDIGCKGMPISKTWENGRFYGGNENNDWRLSFEDEVETTRGGLKSVFYGSDDDVAEREEALKFNQMVMNIRKLREFSYCKGVKSGGNRRAGRKFEKERKLGMRNGDLSEKRSDLDLQNQEEANLVLQEKDIFELKPVKTMKLSGEAKRGNHRNGAYSSKYNYEKTEEDYKLEAMNLNEERKNSEWEKLKEMKFKEVIVRNESQRKSVYITTKNNSKVRAYSPRTAYKIECKIKAIEDMKRAKKKTEKQMREKVGDERAAFDSFAVVKNSSDPQNDFKNSMIEMITVKGIKKAEELEELLACYLTLNADEYHNTIIKVFKQVWFELIRDLHLAPAIHN